MVSESTSRRRRPKASPFPWAETLVAAFLTIIGAALLTPVLQPAVLPVASRDDQIFLDVADVRPTDYQISYSFGYPAFPSPPADVLWVKITTSSAGNVRFGAAGPARGLLRTCDQLGVESTPSPIDHDELLTYGFELASGDSAIFQCFIEPEYTYGSNLGQRWIREPAFDLWGYKPSCLKVDVSRHGSDEYVTEGEAAQTGYDGTCRELTSVQLGAVLSSKSRLLPIASEQATADRLAVMGALIAGFGLAFLTPVLLWTVDEIKRSSRQGRESGLRTKAM